LQQTATRWCDRLACGHHFDRDDVLPVLAGRSRVTPSTRPGPAEPGPAEERGESWATICPPLGPAPEHRSGPPCRLVPAQRSAGPPSSARLPRRSPLPRSAPGPARCSMPLKDA